MSADAPTVFFEYPMSALATFGGLWFDPDKELPDADLTVLVCTRNTGEPVWLGHYNGIRWYDVDGFAIDVVAWGNLPDPPFIDLIPPD